MISDHDPTARLLTTGEAALAAHVSESTIRTWADRELITAAAEGPLYREIDVLVAERQTRRAPRWRQLARDGLASIA